MSADQLEVKFEPSGTFGALNQAQTWLHENGFSYGSLCRDMPVGIVKGDALIAKWRNLSPRDRKRLDGVLLPSPEFREGGCRIVLKGHPDFTKAVAA